ncbi:hypothetical protein [Thermococcus sp. JCM 11816]|uniref:hypothetical protein n=1 Tax=Thermococcus sp. (strain JCM 11816 / KS-1) TaxID=1295125 RepID=UPI000A83DDDC
MPVDLSGPLMAAFKKAKKEYEEAMKRGDLEIAKKKALECSNILKQLSRYDEFNRESYLRKAKKWENLARDIESGRISSRTQSKPMREGSSRPDRGRAKSKARRRSSRLTSGTIS